MYIDLRLSNSKVSSPNLGDHPYSSTVSAQVSKIFPRSYLQNSTHSPSPKDNSTHQFLCLVTGSGPVTDKASNLQGTRIPKSPQKRHENPVQLHQLGSQIHVSETVYVDIEMAGVNLMFTNVREHVLHFFKRSVA